MVDPKILSASPPLATAKATSRRESASFVTTALLIAAVAIGGFAALPRLGGPKVTPAADRSEAPRFELPVLRQAGGGPSEGARVALGDLKGQPVLIDFWATWCGPCRMQTPILNRIAKRYEARGLKVIGVNVHDDDQRAALAYANQKELAYPIIVDEKGITQRNYGVNRLPSMVLVDREGRIMQISSGVVDESTLERMVESAL